VTPARKPQPFPRGERAGAAHSGTVVVRLIEPAVHDLRRLLRKDPQIVRWALKTMLLLERDPHAGVPLHGALAGYRKLVLGDRDWRIVWRVRRDEQGAVLVDIAEVWAVGARNDAEVYREMEERVAALPRTTQAVALAEVVDRLGRAARGIRPQREAPTPGPAVPGWLVDKLVRIAGMDEASVLGLTLVQAVDAWTAWLSRPGD
jgi:mRNA interferase RelE/StbE